MKMAYGIAITALKQKMSAFELSRWKKHETKQKINDWKSE
jgi:hypothetical protein